MIPAAELSVGQRVLRKLRTEIANRTREKPVNWPTGLRVVSFTFDDFPTSAATIGAEILEDHGGRGTYYAAGSLIGRPSPSGLVADELLIRDISKRGHEIACHTFSHLDCSIAPVTAVAADCTANRLHLGQLGLPALTSFAFPYGGLNRRARRELATVYGSLRTAWPGINRGWFDIGALRAVPLMERDGQLVAHAHLKRLLSADGGRVFYGHDVSPTPSRFGCSPDFLASLCSAVREGGAMIHTVASACRFVDEPSIALSVR